MKVQSMFIGKPKQLGDANAMDKMQQAWVSAINRDRVDSGFVDILGFNGDEVADKNIMVVWIRLCSVILMLIMSHGVMN